MRQRKIFVILPLKFLLFPCLIPPIRSGAPILRCVPFPESCSGILPKRGKRDRSPKETYERMNPQQEMYKEIYGNYIWNILPLHKEKYKRQCQKFRKFPDFIITGHSVFYNIPVFSADFIRSLSGFLSISSIFVPAIHSDRPEPAAYAAGSHSSVSSGPLSGTSRNPSSVKMDASISAGPPSGIRSFTSH